MITMSVYNMTGSVDLRAGCAFWSRRPTTFIIIIINHITFNTINSCYYLLS